VVYKKGSDNRVADALSRRPDSHSATSFLALSSCQPKWIDEIVQSYSDDVAAQDMIAKLVLDSSVVPNFTYTNGLLRCKTRLWVGDDVSLHFKLITVFHSSAVGDHSGVSVTYRRLKQLFAWKGMKFAVHDFV
jgi:hypothetical protein